MPLPLRGTWVADSAKELVSMMHKVYSKLELSEVTCIVVTIGRCEDIAKFREETEFSGEIYVDADLHTPRCYSTMKLRNGQEYLLDPKTSEFLPSTAEAAARANENGFADGGYGNDDSPYTGDVFQVINLVSVF